MGHISHHGSNLCGGVPPFRVLTQQLSNRVFIGHISATISANIGHVQVYRPYIGQDSCEASGVPAPRVTDRGLADRPFPQRPFGGSLGRQPVTSKSSGKPRSHAAEYRRRNSSRPSLLRHLSGIAFRLSASESTAQRRWRAAKSTRYSATIAGKRWARGFTFFYIHTQLPSGEVVELRMRISDGHILRCYQRRRCCSCARHPSAPSDENAGLVIASVMMPPSIAWTARHLDRGRYAGRLHRRRVDRATSRMI
jgi:hypothetical protein